LPSFAEHAISPDRSDMPSYHAATSGLSQPSAEMHVSSCRTSRGRSTLQTLNGWHSFQSAPAAAMRSHSKSEFSIKSRQLTASSVLTRRPTTGGGSISHPPVVTSRACPIGRDSRWTGHR